MVATEDQLKIEVMARRLEITQNVGPLAASLYRSWNLQQALLQQATNEIARLELLLMKPYNRSASLNSTTVPPVALAKLSAASAVAIFSSIAFMVL